MNERQQRVCAIALFADGWEHKQIGAALGVDEERTTELVNAGAEEQRNNTMGNMRNCPAGDGRVVSARDENGDILRTVPRLGGDEDAR